MTSCGFPYHGNRSFAITQDDVLPLSSPRQQILRWRSEILIKGIKEEIAYSAAGDDKAVRTFLHLLAPRVVKTASFASTSLSATNPVIHVTASLFNVTRIENKEDFYFFGAPMTDRVISFMEHCDEERLAVGKALGIRLSPLL